MPRLEVFLFYQIKISAVKQADLRDQFKMASNNVHTSTIGRYILISCLLLPTTSSAKKTPENTEEHPDNRRPADEGDNKMKYSSD